MLQIKTLITALTVICIASVCLAGLVTFMLWREAGRVLDQRHIRDKMRSTSPIAKLSPAETTMARALFRQAAGGPEAFAAQNLATPALLESHQPLALQTQIKRRMAAEQLELEFSEDELAHAYFEHTYYSKGEYGLDLASRSMFGKDPVDLTEDEALALAAVTRAPALRSDPERLALWVTKQKEQVK
jgi:hypothetical protein